MGRRLALPPNFRTQFEREVRDAWRRPHVKTARDVEHELENTHLGLLEMYRDACPVEAHRWRFYQRHRPADLGERAVWRARSDAIDQVIEALPNHTRWLMGPDPVSARKHVEAILVAVRKHTFRPGGPEDREIERDVLVASIEARVGPVSVLRKALMQVSRDLAQQPEKQLDQMFRRLTEANSLP